MYKFKIPIGDWSSDGHGKCEYHLIESSLPIEEVRELYFQACDKIGFSLDGSYKQTELTPAHEYRDYKFKKETLRALLDFGVKIPEEKIKYIEKQGYLGDFELFIDIILAFIMTQDKNLKLKQVSDFEDMLPFYGYDKKRRHIGYFGYGLFD